MEGSVTVVFQGILHDSAAILQRLLESEVKLVVVTNDRKGKRHLS